jgi:dTDP-4-dehydro-6-deoxy-alpha-D-glucopyranose 2,3-dehydratase
MDQFINNSLDLKAELLFLQSALTLQNKFNSTFEILEWLKIRNQSVAVNITQIKFSQLNDWFFDESVNKLQHSSGKFFSIEGINVETNSGNVKSWDQPIINQPEIGFLGIITKEFDGVLFFLMQAKIEPGNVNYVQISPTLQATKSNYSQVHKGKKPLYLDYFLDRQSNEILLDQLQSEQGARFLKKRNRNIVIKINSEIEVHEDFCWLTLGQIKELIKFSNIINMDTRTVISGISFGSHLSKTINFFNFFNNLKENFNTKLLESDLNGEQSLFTFSYIIHWFTNLKSMYELIVTQKKLKDLKGWVIEDECIRHSENKFFKVIAVHVEIGNREVTSWDQPLVQPVQEGICAFIIKEIKGVIHFLVQAKVESGNFDVLEMAPTVQCLTGSYENNESRATLPYLNYILTAKNENIIFDTYQSEEGGRFYREQNRSIIALADSTFSVETPTNYTWMTLNQLKTFIKFNNYLNIQARSLVSAISYV